MLSPKEYIGPLMELGQERRGVFKEMNYITENRASIIYELPLAEVIQPCNAVLINITFYAHLWLKSTCFSNLCYKSHLCSILKRLFSSFIYHFFIHTPKTRLTSLTVGINLCFNRSLVFDGHTNISGLILYRLFINLLLLCNNFCLLLLVTTCKYF